MAEIAAATARPATPQKLLRDVVEVVAVALTLYLAAAFSLETVHVVGDSMFPTLENQDLLLASKLDYRVHDPQRGDIIILKSPIDPSRDYIKRVIGIPGDHVLIRDYAVIINGRRLEEPYVQSWFTGADWPVIPDAPDGEEIPPDRYFVLGDNRDHSSDSRLFGWVSRNQIEAHAVLRVWPLPHAGSIQLTPSLANR